VTKCRAHLILALTQLIDEGGAALGVLAAVEAVQLGSHLVELLVGIVELGQQRAVVFLRSPTTGSEGSAAGPWGRQTHLRFVEPFPDGVHD